MIRIEVYSAGNCPWCNRAKSLLRTRGLEFEEIDITAGAARAVEMIARSGQRTVPQIFIDDEHIGGFNALSMLNLSDRPD
jgi:glutaredoxin 3